MKNKATYRQEFFSLYSNLLDFTGIYMTVTLAVLNIDNEKLEKVINEEILQTTMRIANCFDQPKLTPNSFPSKFDERAGDLLMLALDLVIGIDNMTDIISKEVDEELPSLTDGFRQQISELSY